MNFLKKNIKIIFGIFLFTILFSASSASAGVCSCYSGTQCETHSTNDVQGFDSMTSEEKNQVCYHVCVNNESKKYDSGIYQSSLGGMTACTAAAISHPVDATVQATKDSFQRALEAVVKWLLYAILKVVGWLVLIAVTILKWILDVNSLKLFLDSSAIRDVWVMTRDFLNIGFIFVLLFSAFCTIFQVEKYHIKSILFKLVLMALLVNFSFPISRFIIDVSNVMMYWLLNNVFSGISDGAGIFASISKGTDISNLLLPKSLDSYDISYIIAAIIFSFIFGITLLIIAVMFVIRLVALAVLVMFSPVGFAAAAFPMVSQYSSKWWDALFKYSFFAPIMVFMLAVSLKMMEAIGAQNQSQNGGLSGMYEAASSQTTGGTDIASFIAQAAFFTIPIIILWIGMGIAQTLSIAGAGAVTGKGRQFAKWAGKSWGGGRQLARVTGVSGGVKAGVAKFQKNGKLFGVKVPMYGGSDAREAKEAKWAGLVSGGLSGRQAAITDHERKKVNETRKEWKDQGGADKKNLQEAVAKGASANAKSEDKIKAKAAALELAENHGFKDLAEFKNAANSVANDPVMKKMFDDKAKEKHIKFVIDKDAEDTINKTEERLQKQGRSLTDDEKKRIRGHVYNKRLSGMSTDDLAKQKDLHKGIGNDVHLQEYIRDNIANDPQRHMNMFRKMNVSNQKAYVSAGYDPRSMAQSRQSQNQSQNQNQNQNQNQYQQYRNANYQNTP